MIEIALRTSLSPSVEMSTPSILIEPDTSSTIRNNAIMIDDFPAPVLHCASSEQISDVERRDIPSNNAYFLASLDAQAEALQDQRKFRAILQGSLIDFKLPIAGPRSRWFLFWDLIWRLLLEVMSIIDDTLDGIHVVLDLGKLLNDQTKGLE